MTMSLYHVKAPSEDFAHAIQFSCNDRPTKALELAVKLGEAEFKDDGYKPKLFRPGEYGDRILRDEFIPYSISLGDGSILTLAKEMMCWNRQLEFYHLVKTSWEFFHPKSLSNPANERFSDIAWRKIDPSVAWAIYVALFRYPFIVNDSKSKLLSDFFSGEIGGVAIPDFGFLFGHFNHIPHKDAGYFIYSEN